METLRLRWRLRLWWQQVQIRGNQAQLHLVPRAPEAMPKPQRPPDKRAARIKRLARCCIAVSGQQVLGDALAVGPCGTSWRSSSGAWCIPPRSQLMQPTKWNGPPNVPGLCPRAVHGRIAKASVHNSRTTSGCSRSICRRARSLLVLWLVFLAQPVVTDQRAHTCLRFQPYPPTAVHARLACHLGRARPYAARKAGISR